MVRRSRSFETLSSEIREDEYGKGFYKRCETHIRVREVGNILRELRHQRDKVFKIIRR